MKTIYFRAGTEHIAFEWVHRHMAEALAAGEPQFELRLSALLETLPRELQADVDSGKLPVKDPLTMGPNSFNIGGALDSARVLVSDLRNYVAKRGVVVVEMPEVIRRARVVCIDPALTNFPRDAWMHYSDCIGIRSSSAFMTALLPKLDWPLTTGLSVHTMGKYLPKRNDWSLRLRALRFSSVGLTTL